MTGERMIFGYGSLLNIKSVRRTVPDVTGLVPVILNGYVRSFETKSSRKWTKDNRSISVLTVKEKEGAMLNGVCFEVTEEYLNSLLQREKAYDFKECEVQTFDKKQKFKAFLFVQKSSEEYDFMFGEEAQENYLKTCLRGASDFGEDFFDTFLQTTFINGKELIEISELNNIVDEMRPKVK